MARRVNTEQQQQYFRDQFSGHYGGDEDNENEDDYYQINPQDEDEDEYVQVDEDDEEYGEEDQEDFRGGNQDNGEGNDNLLEYKGIYFNDDQGQKFTDPETGAHFEFRDMVKRLNYVLQERGNIAPSGTTAGNDTKQSTQGTLMDYQQNLDNKQNPAKKTFQQEKEEFIKSLGLQKLISNGQKDQKQLPQPIKETQTKATAPPPLITDQEDEVVQNQRQDQQKNNQIQKNSGGIHLKKSSNTQQTQQLQQQNVMVQEGNGGLAEQYQQQLKENNKNLLAQMIKQQPDILMKQVTKQSVAGNNSIIQAPIQMKSLGTVSESLQIQRSKSTEKTAFNKLTQNSQVAQQKTKTSGNNFNLQSNPHKQDFSSNKQQQSIQVKGNGSKQTSNVGVDPNLVALALGSSFLQQQRGKTPDTTNKGGRQKELITQAQQTIQKLKATLGYNDQQKTSSAQGKTRSSQRSNRDNKLSNGAVNNIIGQKSIVASKMLTNNNNANVQNSLQIANNNNTHSRNGKGSSATSTYYKNLTKAKGTQQKKQSMNPVCQTYQHQMVQDIDSLMVKFNNSLALQNIGNQASIQNAMVGNGNGISKSRNGANHTGITNNQNNQGVAFKTTASINTTSKNNNNNEVLVKNAAITNSTGKNINQTNKKHLKSNKQSIVAGSDIGSESKKASKVTTSSNKYRANNNVNNNSNIMNGQGSIGGVNTTNNNLYSMIYQNRTKNLVSSYLKNIDTTSNVKQNNVKVGAGSSRNQALAAPAGTKKVTKSSAMMGSGNDNDAINKSLVGGRLY